MSQEIDYLTEDTFTPKGQKYVCVSFLPPLKNDLTLTGIKIRGVFNEYDKACEFAKKSQSYDNKFNVYVGEMGKWLPFDPDPNSKASGDSQYANKQLNDMMKKYNENQEKAQELHHHIKNEKVIKNYDENIKVTKSTLETLQEELKNETNEENKEQLETNLESLKETLQSLENNKQEIEELEKQLLDESSDDDENLEV